MRVPFSPASSPAFIVAGIESQDAPQPTNGLRKCGIHTQWNFTQPQRRMKFCHSQVTGWNWRTSSLAKIVRLRRPKIVFSPSFEDYRPKTNAVILSDMGHTQRGECARGE
jgi:hypothetical protein